MKHVISRCAVFTGVLLAAPAAAQARSSLPQNGDYTEPPRLLNQPEVTALALSSYPRQLKEMGLGGSPYVRLYIDETGAVAERRIERSSALPALDSAALKVVWTRCASPPRRTASGPRTCG